MMMMVMMILRMRRTKGECLQQEDVHNIWSKASLTFAGDGKNVASKVPGKIPERVSDLVARVFCKFQDEVSNEVSKSEWISPHAKPQVPCPPP